MPFYYFGKVLDLKFNKQVIMKKILLPIVCFLVSCNVFAQELPNTQIKDLNSGKKVSFNEIIEKDKISVISFWATWCIPCKKEIKNMSLQLDNWKKEVDFNYITISIDESKAEGLARSYALNQGWKFPYYIDPNSDLKRSLSFQNVPFTIIVDKKGKIAFMHTGYETGGENEIFAKIKELSTK